ncbi:family 43 glycosylhydrolase [Stratiformator vulcanicus]|uniref:Beta-xylosidase n=1 Tax=Stratiformator vulcanicus TaxID=2527980 RepID=A0A517R1X0_9PLAN|nr:family 43 glycosylhydrolase [Stratiformator vulcanicus]QDT37868.1 Beta-xylosidase [Stratiformator vulcanicus]
MAITRLLCVAVVISTVVAAMHATSADEIQVRPTEARPILLGNWADPTVLKDGEDYYMTHSSFNFEPGLLIWHSKNLRDWKPLTHALQRADGSVWAPELVKHEGTYYLYYPLTDSVWDIFVTTATDPAGPWSEPKRVFDKLIDPGHVVAPDGSRYLMLNDGKYVRLSDDGTRATTELKSFYNGWKIPLDWTIECECLESPKFTKHDGWYHLTSAMGGTGGPSTSHMIVAARSRTPLGPWEESPYNPIVRTWDRTEAWWSKGHGTPVEGPGGHWWMMLHGFKNGQRTLGRATLVEPLEWTDDGWYRVPDEWPEESLPWRAVEVDPSDEFESEQPGIFWQFHRKWEHDRINVSDGELTLKGRGADPGRSRPLCSYTFDEAYEIETELRVGGSGTAGIILFASPGSLIGMQVDRNGSVSRIQKGFRKPNRVQSVETPQDFLTLRIVNDRQDVSFWVKNADGDWKNLWPSAEVSKGGTLRPALFATGESTAKFKYYRYRPLRRE